MRRAVGGGETSRPLAATGRSWGTSLWGVGTHRWNGREGRRGVRERSGRWECGQWRDSGAVTAMVTRTSESQGAHSADAGAAAGEATYKKIKNKIGVVLARTSRHSHPTQITSSDRLNSRSPHSKCGVITTTPQDHSGAAARKFQFIIYPIHTRPSSSLLITVDPLRAGR